MHICVYPYVNHLVNQGAVACDVTRGILSKYLDQSNPRHAGRGEQIVQNSTCSGVGRGNPSCRACVTMDESSS